MQNARRFCCFAEAKRIKSVFCRGAYAAENTAQPADVRRRRALEQAAKLAQFFNVSTDYLLSLPELPDEGKMDVTPEERKLLTAYRKLSEDYRDIIMGDIKKYLIAQGDR